MPTELERYRGALLGLAAGDALGTTLEFRQPGTFEPISDIVGGGPFGLAAGEWTDDTSMALCLAESLIELRGFDAVDQLQRYVRWWRDGYWSSNGRCFDIGNAVCQALAAFERTGRPSGLTDPYSAGNGSIMRLAPVPMFYANSLDAAIDFAAQSSETTHATPQAVAACRYLAALLARALQGAAKDEILETPPSFYPALGELPPLVAKIAGGSFKRLNPPDIRGTGYVIESLEAALWAFHNSESFAEGALMAVNLGDDADTTGAVYGQIAGAHYGESGIPQHWRNMLARGDEIGRLAEQLYHLRPTFNL